MLPLCEQGVLFDNVTNIHGSKSDFIVGAVVSYWSIYEPLAICGFNSTL